MDTDFRSLLLHGQPFDVGLQNVSSPLGVHNRIHTNGNAQPFQPIVKELQPHCQLYCSSGPNVVHNGKYIPGVELPGKNGASTSGCTPKQFLVFDQSGDKTTLIYSSGIDNPSCLNPWNSNSRKMGIWRETRNVSGPTLTNELNANDGEAEDDREMREDTEEINALLYSDDDSAEDEEDGDVASTGHSPNIVTAYNDDKQDWFEMEDGEEVASSGGPTKRQRISEDGCAANSGRTRTLVCEDDAESKCAVNHAQFLKDDDEDTDSLCGKKRWRKEKLRKTIEILQSIIPCGKGMDAALVLDESIQYLRSLRYKASLLGLSAT